MSSNTLAVFRYIDELDCFVVTDEYRTIADRLALSEWNPVVWIGRLFCMDNDFGEHWFDNWELREQLETEAKRQGIAYEDLLIIDPERLQDGRDGPCHPAGLRKRFWTDVLRSLELSYELLFDEARRVNEAVRAQLPEDYVVDLEERIAKIQAER